MKQSFISASGLDARGVGPRIMLATTPVLAAAIFLVRQEEVQLLKCFGRKYYEYKSRVGLFFSFPLITKQESTL